VSVHVLVSPMLAVYTMLEVEAVGGELAKNRLSLGERVDSKERVRRCSKLLLAFIDCLVLFC
jgi:hypothetical protein